MRRRPSKWPARRWCPPCTARWTPCTAVWVCWGPPGWTIRELSPASPRLLFILARSWVLDERAPAKFVDRRGNAALKGPREVRRGTRLLRAARREQKRRRCGDQTRLPQAGARVAPRHQSRRRRAGEVQGNQRRLRGAERSRETPDRRPGRGPAGKRGS